MTLSERQCDFTYRVSMLIQKADQLRMRVAAIDWGRDLETQKRYVAMKKSKTMNSKHLDNLAVDLKVIKDGKAYQDYDTMKPLGEYWESLGGRWGGRFGEDLTKVPPVPGWDAPHFEA